MVDLDALPEGPALLDLGAGATATEGHRLCAQLVGRDQGWLRIVRTLVARADAATLAMLAEGVHPIHAVLRDNSPQVDALAPGLVVGDDEESDDEESDELERACRAMAALGAVVVDPGRADLRDLALRWYRQAPVPESHTGGQPIPSLDADPFAVALRVEGAAAPPFAVLLAAYLAGRRPRWRRRVRLGVLFDRFRDGEHGQLELATAAELGPTILPDPSSMALFRGDAPFHEAIDRAWSLQPGRRGVVWSLQADTGAVDAVIGGSLGAAFAVGLRELAVLDRPARRWCRLRRLGSPSRAITGDITATGRLVPVGGLDNKLRAAVEAKATRVVIPTDEDVGDIRRERLEGVEVVRAGDMAEASRQVRRFDRTAALRVGLAVLLVLAVGLTATVATTTRSRADARDEARRLATENRRTELSALADRTAQQARDLATTSSDGLALLLAMAAEDLADDAGRRTDVLADVQDRNRAPIHIMRPDRGAYVSALASSSHRYAAAWTDDGTADVADVLSGERVWGVAYPPGSALNPSQVRIDAVASSPVTDMFAVALSTREVQLVVPAEEAVVPIDPIPLDLPSRSGRFGELNSLRLLTFAPDGSTLVGYGLQAGVLELDLAGSLEGPSRTCPPSEAFRPVDIGVAEDGAVLGVTEDGSVLRLDLETCTTSPARPGIAGFEAGDLEVTDDGPVVAGALGREVVVVTARGEQRSVAENGPYRSITLSPGAQEVAASSGDGAFQWAADDGARQAGFRTGLTVLDDEQGTLWVHEGIVEAFRPEMDYSAIFSARSGAMEVAVGGDRVLLGSLGRVATAQLGPGRDGISTFLPDAPVPEGDDVAVSHARLSATGRTALVTARPSDEAPRQLVLWETSSGRALAVPPASADDPAVNAAEFVGGSDEVVLAGHRAGQLTLLRRSAGDRRWQREDELDLGDPVLSLSVSDDGRRAAVLTGAAGTGTAYVHLVELGAGLRVRNRRDLERPTGALGRVVLLDEGDIVTIVGSGQLDRLGPALTTESSSEIDMGDVVGMVEVPGRDQLLVVGRLTSALVSSATLRPVSEPPIAGAFGLVTGANVSPDGRFLLTSHFLGGALPRVTLWNIDPDDARGRACQTVGRELTRAEWERFVGDGAPYRELCADWLRSPSPPGDLSAVPLPPLLQPAEGPCPAGTTLGHDGSLQLVRGDDGTVAACRGRQRVGALTASFEDVTLDPTTARLVHAGEPRADGSDVGWYLVVDGIEDDEPTTVAALQHGLDTLDVVVMGEIADVVVRRVPHAPESFPRVALVVDEFTQFLAQAYLVDDGDTSSVQIRAEFAWPAALGADE